MANSYDQEFWIGEQCRGDLRSCKEIELVSGGTRLFLANEVELKAAAADAPVYRAVKDETKVSA